MAQPDQDAPSGRQPRRAVALPPSSLYRQAVHHDRPLAIRSGDCPLALNRRNDVLEYLLPLGSAGRVVVLG